MKKSFLILVVAACATFTANAQKISFGVKGGLNIAKLTDYDNSKVRASIFAGGYANFAFNENLSVQPELLYSGQGNKYEVLNTDFTNKLGYINIPVMVQYRIVPEFYLEAGPQLGFLASAKTKSGKVTVDIKDDCKTVDFGLGFGVGYQFSNGFGIGGRYMFGLTKVSEDENLKRKNSVAQIGVFYTFNHK
ncbi:Outer membrane protein beta-barrel domain-containing protein [Chitinophaga sp. CF118]|uniref:porin family protein n=1 Tax=Chitinophaga sp. CF118 TaxID=1884367 RepID=UPI0008E7382D|nr:porin family protein [Chitinophaga sp. CF118]SFE05330.1 Outer membrane protein beta-barrel domain-containing protein [Chitinophaga sp. CF118]